MVQTGAAFGSLTRESQIIVLNDSGEEINTTKTDSIDFGGVLLGVGGEKDFSGGFAASAQASLLIDSKKQDIIQQGLQATGIWHVIGSSRNLQRGRAAEDVLLKSNSISRLSFLGQISLFRYAVVGRDLSRKFSGSTLDGRAGIRYGSTVFGLDTAVQVITTVFSSGADEAHMKSQSMELSLLWYP